MPIRPGTANEATRESGDWIFIDVGFANQSKTCGVLIGEGQPTNCTFSALKQKLSEICTKDQGSLNLVLEAPLSVAFGSSGNPTSRSIEKRNGKTRYWYVGLGCSVLVATTYLLRFIYDQEPTRNIRLFEGFVSFKRSKATSSHSDDVEILRTIAWHQDPKLGRIIGPNELPTKAGDRVESAFLVSGMDFGVPAIIMAES